jgi:hypothetical protein
VFVKIGPHIYNFGLLVHAELDARVEDQTQPRPSTMAGGRVRIVDGVVLTFAVPSNRADWGGSLQVRLQGAEAEAVRELFNTLSRAFNYQPLEAGEVVEVLLPQPQTEESDHR